MQGAQVEANALGLTPESIEVWILVDRDDGGRKGGGGPHGGGRGTPVLSCMAVGFRVIRVILSVEAKVVWTGSAHMATVGLW